MFHARNWLAHLWLVFNPDSQTQIRIIINWPICPRSDNMTRTRQIMSQCLSEDVAVILLLMWHLVSGSGTTGAACDQWTDADKCDRSRALSWAGDNYQLGFIHKYQLCSGAWPRTESTLRGSNEWSNDRRSVFTQMLSTQTYSRNSCRSFESPDIGFYITQKLVCHCS